MTSLNAPVTDEENARTLEDMLPSPNAGPDAEFTRAVLMQSLEDAIDELPASQREVFVAHEVLGKSFRQISEETGIGVNTLLSRKRYAVLHLRARLKQIYEDYGQ